MGLFNFLKHNNKESSTGSESELIPPASGWDSLAAETEFNEVDRAAELKAARLARQGDKLIAAFERGPSVLSIKTVEVTDAERQAFFDQLNSGQITAQDQSRMLQQISLPGSQGGGRYNFEPSFQKINNDHGRKILAFTGGFGFYNSASMSSDHLRYLLETCPTPLEFASREADMLQTLIRSGNSPAKIDAYREDLETFKQSVYGKRYEYAQALDALKTQATTMQQSSSATPTELSPLDDSMAYWAPEAKQNFQSKNPNQ